MTVRANLAAAILKTVLWLGGGAGVKATSAAEDIDVIRADFNNRLFEAFIGFVSQSGSVTKWRNDAAGAVAEDVIAAFERGIEDGGGDRADIDPDDSAWATAKQAEQIDFLDGVFDWLKELRADDTATEDGIQARVDMWVATLDAIYSEGKMRGARNQMLEWRIGETEHCTTCADLQGQKHKASWYLARDYIPGKPGAAMECGGYRCQCALYDKDGNEFTI